MSVTLEAAKAHLNITGTDDDALISSKIEAAEGWASNYIGTPIAELDPFPAPVGEAVLQLVAHWYEQREAAIAGVAMEEAPFSVIDILRPYRKWAF